MFFVTIFKVIMYCICALLITLTLIGIAWAIMAILQTIQNVFG